MDTEKEALCRHFDAYAPGWHARMSNHVYAMRYRAVERIVSRLPIASVLDVGCGTGDYSRLFEPDRVRYLGIDISEKMIAECRRLFPRHEFSVGDGDSVDAPAASFDLALSVGVMEYLSQPLNHLRELARVVRTGGSIIAAVPNGSNRSKRLDRPVRRILDSRSGRAVRRILGRPVDRAASDHQGYVKSDRIRHRPMTVAELRDLGSAAGLTLVERTYVSLYLLPELIPGAGAVNALVSRLVSGRPGWSWLTRSTALVLVARLERGGSGWLQLPS